MESEFTLAALAVSIVHLIGAYNAVHVIFNGRTPQGAIAWMLSLLFFPYVAVPLYWTFGPSKFFQYVEVLSRSSYIQQQRLGPKEAEVEDQRGRLASPFDTSQEVLEKLAGWPVTAGNALALLEDGEEVFQNYFKLIDDAEKYILLAFYIVRDDQIGHALKDKLIAAAGRGVQVYFLFDQVGSMHLSQSFVDELRQHGIFVESFRTTKGKLLSRFRLNFRNHRKIVLTDGTAAIVGGLNVGDEYLGKVKYFGRWRDTALLIRGPSVLGIQKTFLQDWYWVTETLPRLSWTPELRYWDLGAPVLVLPTGPTAETDAGELWILELLRTARTRVWCASPYFAPTEAVMQALHLAVLRGVNVRILCPSFPDHKIIYFAGLAFIDELQKAGGEVFRYEGGFMHQKVMLIDDGLASVGTVNIDSRSMRLNFELSLVTTDQKIVSEIEQMLLRDFRLSEKVVEDDLARSPRTVQLLAHGSRLLAPVL